MQKLSVIWKKGEYFAMLANKTFNQLNFTS